MAHPMAAFLGELMLDVVIQVAHRYVKSSLFYMLSRFFGMSLDVNDEAMMWI